MATRVVAVVDAASRAGRKTRRPSTRAFERSRRTAHPILSAYPSEAGGDCPPLQHSPVGSICRRTSTSR